MSVPTGPKQMKNILPSCFRTSKIRHQSRAFLLRMRVGDRLAALPSTLDTVPVPGATAARVAPHLPSDDARARRARAAVLRRRSLVERALQRAAIDRGVEIPYVMCGVVFGALVC